jgi:hypothetical protein
MRLRVHPIKQSVGKFWRVMVEKGCGNVWPKRRLIVFKGIFETDMQRTGWGIAVV